MSAQRIGHHLQISEMRTSFVSQDGPASLVLAVHSLSVQITRQGLNQLVRHLVPDVSVEVGIGDSGTASGIDLIVQATHWGFKARVRVRLRIDEHVPESIGIDLAAASTWSLLDHTMLAIIGRKLRDVSRKHPQVTSTGPRSFQVNLQPLILQQVIETGVPIQWNARLSRMNAKPDAIDLTFTTAVPVESVA